MEACTILITAVGILRNSAWTYSGRSLTPVMGIAFFWSAGALAKIRNTIAIVLATAMILWMI